MKKIIEKTLVILLGLPIGTVIFVLIAGIATVLLPIYAVCKCVEYIIRLFKHDYMSEMLDTFIEFIFVLYGFSTLFMLLPLAAIDPEFLD